MAEGAPPGHFAPAAGPVSVVVLHEAYGLRSPRSNVPAFCDRLAAAGFAAFAPDLYDGAAADDVAGALKLMAALDPARASSLVERAALGLGSRIGQRVAVLGFCMGGALAFGAALDVDGLAGAVVFYGTPRAEPERLRVPVQAHFALRDDYVSLDTVRERERALGAAGRDADFFYYDAEHGFMNETLAAYAPAAAALAWARTLGFLERLARTGGDR